MAVTVNYVWLGDGVLKAADKFNIYCWRALGHTVNIYTCRFSDDRTPSAEELGLVDGDAQIVDLAAQLTADATAAENTPKHILGNARTVLQTWLAALRTEKAEDTKLLKEKEAKGETLKEDERRPKQEHRYNAVDLTKSYIGATRQGIVLDLKVGPSQWVPSYDGDRGSFATKFISYSRGRTTTSVENQCIGTMQAKEDLRKLYATQFKTKAAGLKADQFSASQFNLLTGYHAESWKACGSNKMDAAKDDPTGATFSTVKQGLDTLLYGNNVPKSATNQSLDQNKPWAVGELGWWNKGPFRVFKMPNDQSNQGSGGTTDDKVKGLALDAWGKFGLSKRVDQGHQAFATKAVTALRAMPGTTKIPEDW